ncbi:MAG: pyridoxal-dependent decarboxylase, partial [Acidobacteria bacterium]|nr:pyridoxal-dependent decarboxylase [Acidobacteriota bacterium]
MSEEWLYPYYLGPYGENDHVIERYLLTFLRDHVFWRRNLHPDDLPAIPVSAQYTHEFTDFVSRMAQELHALSSDLKRSVPWFSPRYLGHMASDLLMPGLLAQVITTFYNPNNVVEDASPATLNKELEVGRQLAEMFGFNTDPAEYPCAWGHLTSGGTVANYEALWQFRSAKLYPLALRDTLIAYADFEGPQPRSGFDYRTCTPWQLLNLELGEIMGWRREVFAVLQNKSAAYRRTFIQALKANRFENRGIIDFFRQHQSVKPPVVLIASTAHYSWEKAMKIMGLGTHQLVPIAVDEHMRLDAGALHETLARCQMEEHPVLAVVGVLGTTEFGTVDPINALIKAREEWQKQGLSFFVHVDAAFGGYMASVFRNKDGKFRKRSEIRKQFQHFPSKHVYEAFKALAKADSITVDPHKLGYLPYPSGAFVARNREVSELIAQDAPYVFDVAAQQTDFSDKLRNLGKYIFEGSKPGASAAAAFVTHKVVPLNHTGMGRIIGHTIRTCEALFEAIGPFAERWKERVLVRIPIEPDTNLLCLAMNPVGNTHLAGSNAFCRRVFQDLKIRPQAPNQNNPFFAS